MHKTSRALKVRCWVHSLLSIHNVLFYKHGLVPTYPNIRHAATIRGRSAAAAESCSKEEGV